MITRNEAISLCYDLIDSGILSEDIESEINELAMAIEAEQCGLHVWGMDVRDYGIISTAFREDLITPEVKAEMNRINEENRFIPSKREVLEDDEESGS